MTTKEKTKKKNVIPRLRVTPHTWGFYDTPTPDCLCLHGSVKAWQNYVLRTGRAHQCLTVVFKRRRRPSGQAMFAQLPHCVRLPGGHVGHAAEQPPALYLKVHHAQQESIAANPE